MGRSSITLKRRQPILIGYVCAWCGAPVLTVVTINVNVSKYYSFSESKATKVANETLDWVVDKEKRRIRDCIYSYEPLTTNPYKKGEQLDNGCAYASWIDDVRVECPNCLNIEPWQSSEYHGKMIRELRQENFPVIFEENEESVQWVNKIIDEKNTPIGIISKSFFESENKKERVINDYLKIKALKEERKNIAGLSKLEQIETQKRIVTELKDRVGLLDFKGRKIVRDALKELTTEYTKVNSLVKEKQSKIDSELLELRLELQVLQSIVYGSTGEIIEKKRLNSVAYMLKAKGILKKDVDEYLSKNRTERG